MIHDSKKVLDIYFDQNKYFITKHHIDSYNAFVSSSINKVINSMNPFTIPKYDVNNNLLHEINVYIENITFSPCTLLPNECRINNKSYLSEAKADIRVNIKNYENKKNYDKILKNVFLFNLPIMLHSQICKLATMTANELRDSGECIFDQGGYFIIDGKEKVIIAQERNLNNKLFVEKIKDEKEHKYQAFIKCTSEENSVFPKTLWLYVTTKNCIHVKVTHITANIPLFVLFRALGVESDKQIIEYLDIEDSMLDYIRPSILEASKLGIYSQNSALEYIKDFSEYNTVHNVLYIFFEDFLPNISGTFLDKAKILGQLVKELLYVSVGHIVASDRDSFISKRIGTSGYLLGDIFKDFYNVFRVETMKKIDNKYEYGTNIEGDGIQNIINEVNKKEIFNSSDQFINGLIRSLKGSWGISGSASDQGIVQDLSRISYMSFISHLRRVNSPMDTSIKIRKPHQLDTCQYGIMCPCESPDGASIGLLKNMAILCHISAGVNNTVIFEALKAGNYTIHNKGQSKLCINYNWVGMIDDPQNLVKYIRLLRRNGFINVYISVSWDVLKNTINILTESGRCCRPLFIKGKNIVGNTWKELLIGKNTKYIGNEYHETFINPFEIYKTNTLQTLENNGGCIEYIDIEETNTLLIATETRFTDQSTTHIEIHPSTIFSVYSSTIPLSNHNPGTRNTFSGAQGKQAIGVYATNFNSRIDTMSYLLHYPQKSIVSTQYANYLKTQCLPNGENLIVAIMTYSGYNQEDSIIVNQSAIQRGMFNLTYFKSYISEETIEKNSKGKSRVHITFENPNALKLTKDVKLTKFADYSKIDENGMPILESYIQEDDCIIGKCLKDIKVTIEGNPDQDLFISKTESVTYSSKCEIADKTTSGFVDKVLMFENEKGEKNAKIRLRKVRIPELGDKMASRHGQKGVIGAILPSEEMPFTKDGLVPDIIINPHAFPSRMTIGHLIECILAKAGAVSGFYADGTAFEVQDWQNMSKTMEERGFSNTGDDIMYNGITGEQIACEIFIGPTYYYRLKHMVSDKINYRYAGKKVGMTQQPTKGRSNAGGLRIGEMETNVLLSYGFSAFTKESLMERSDKKMFSISKSSGLLIPVNEKKRIMLEPYHNVVIPFSSKQLILELETMSIGTSLRTDDYVYDEDIIEEDLDNIDDMDDSTLESYMKTT